MVKKLSHKIKKMYNLKGNKVKAINRKYVINYIKFMIKNNKKKYFRIDT